jgi:predicted nucleic acid-binding protein
VSFLLDTCAISDGARSADAGLTDWLGSQPPEACFLSTLTLGEVRKGVMLLEASHPRRTALATWLDRDLPDLYRERILPVTDQVALAWGQLAADGQRAGRLLPVIDGLLLATAAAHGLTFVTRNVGDVAGRGVPVISPWSGRP